MGNLCYGTTDDVASLDNMSEFNNLSREASSPIVESDSVGDAVKDVVSGEVEDAAEELLGEADFALVNIKLSNPTGSSFAGSQAITLLKNVFSGAVLQVSLSVPVDFAVRAFLNAAVLLTAGTDVGDWVKKILQADLTKVQMSISVLREAKLKTAADQVSMQKVDL